MRPRFLWASGSLGLWVETRCSRRHRVSTQRSQRPRGVCAGLKRFRRWDSVAANVTLRRLWDSMGCWLSVLGYVLAVGLEIPFAFIGVHLRFRCLGRRREGGVTRHRGRLGRNTLCAVSGGVPVLVRGMILGSSPRTRMTGEGRRQGSGKTTRRCRRGDRGSGVSHAGGVTFPVPQGMGGPPSRTMTKKEGRGVPIGRHISQQVVSRRYARRCVRDHPIYSPAPMITPAPTNVGTSGNCPKIMNPTPTDPSSWKYWKGAMMLAGARASALTTQ